MVDAQSPRSVHGMLDDDWWRPFTADAQDYELGGAIGLGASSTVHDGAFRLRSITSGEFTGEWRQCAIKVSTSFPDIVQLAREARLLGLSRHPNVLRVLATFTLPPDFNRVAIVTPLAAGGSLAGILDWRTRDQDTNQRRVGGLRLGSKRKEGKGGGEGENHGKLSEEEVKAVVKQVIDGLVYLHTNGFLHRDLKAGNLLLSPDGTVLIADFGVGGDINDASEPDKIPARIDTGLLSPSSSGGPVQLPRLVGKRNSFVGTPSWMAPEVVAGAPYDHKADIWSLGITLLELAYGAVPGSQQKAKDIYVKTVLDDAPVLDRSAGDFSKPMKEFVDACLQKDPSKRPDSLTLLDHPWLKHAKKREFVAESLLGSIPSLEQRLDFGIITPSLSVRSRASSWDFETSSPPSPVKSTHISTVPSRDYLYPLPSPLTPRRSTSRDPLSQPLPSPGGSTPSAISSIPPPSPRVSLHDWAEATGPVSGAGGGGLTSPSAMMFNPPTWLSPSSSPTSARRTPSSSSSWGPQRLPGLITRRSGSEAGYRRPSSRYSLYHTSVSDMNPEPEPKATNEGSSSTTVTVEAGNGMGVRNGGGDGVDGFDRVRTEEEKKNLLRGRKGKSASMFVFPLDRNEPQGSSSSSSKSKLARGDEKGSGAVSDGAGGAGVLGSEGLGGAEDGDGEGSESRGSNSLRMSGMGHGVEGGWAGSPKIDMESIEAALWRAKMTSEPDVIDDDDDDDDGLGKDKSIPTVPGPRSERTPAAAIMDPAATSETASAGDITQPTRTVRQDVNVSVPRHHPDPSVGVTSDRLRPAKSPLRVLNGGSNHLAQSTQSTQSAKPRPEVSAPVSVSMTSNANTTSSSSVGSEKRHWLSRRPSRHTPGPGHGSSSRVVIGSGGQSPTPPATPATATATVPGSSSPLSPSSSSTGAVLPTPIAVPVPIKGTGLNGSGSTSGSASASRRGSHSAEAGSPAAREGFTSVARSLVGSFKSKHRK